MKESLMKRAGFTMIELIFVIVILGILSAVALPKFIGVSEQAKVGKLKAYVGTLNMTTLPAYWSESISDGNNGSIKSYSDNIKKDLVAPDGISVDFNTSLTASYKDFSTLTTYDTTSNVVGSKKYNGKFYSIICNDGNSTSSAHCDLFKSDTNASGVTGTFLLNANN